MVVSYTYDSEGHVSYKTETMPNSAGSRTTAFNHGSTADGTLGPCYSVETQVNGTSISTSLTAANGLGSGTITLGGTTRSVAVLGGPTTTWTAGSWTEITTHPDGTRLRREYVDGRLDAEEQRDSTGATGVVIASTTYGYDDLGRVDSTTDSRTGTVDQGPYTESGNLLSQADSAARTTAWKYDKMGRVTEVDGENTLDASSNTVYNKSYTSYFYDGSVSANWGDQGYALSYAYDEQGRPKEMRTYRALDHNEDPLNQVGTPDAGDPTAWIYDVERGWLTDKDDAASKGAHYSYTAAGRLKTRTWARGAHTLYSYDQGLLSAVDYFTSSAATTVDSLTPLWITFTMRWAD